MARYSRRRGPLVDFELTASVVLIPGFTITRSYGRGTLLICGHVRVRNVGVAVVAVNMRIELDGVRLGDDDLAMNVGISENIHMGFSFLEPIQLGVHTVEVLILGSVAVGDVVPLGSSELCVIELPEWDRDDDIITL